MKKYNITIANFGDFEMESNDIFYCLKALRCYLGLRICDFVIIKVVEIKEDNSIIDITILIN